VFTDAELMNGEIAEPVFIVPGLIPEGLTVISGRPKMGKTSFCMNIADAGARGGYALGSIKCPQHEVLFLALEDNKRRPAETPAHDARRPAPPSRTRPALLPRLATPR
jgi:hypothetical protein